MSLKHILSPKLHLQDKTLSFYILLAVNKSHEKTKTNNVFVHLPTLSDFLTLSVALQIFKMGHKYIVLFLTKAK